MTLASCSNPSRNGMLIRLDSLCAVAAVYQGAHPCRCLPVGSAHSTLIKVSSIRSGGIGNRPITRASALSTPWLPINSLQTSFPLPFSLLESLRKKNIWKGRLFLARRRSVASSLSIPPGGCQEPKGTTRVRVVIRRLVNHSLLPILWETERSAQILLCALEFARRGAMVDQSARGKEREYPLFTDAYPERRNPRFDRRLLNRGTIVITITEAVVSV